LIEKSKILLILDLDETLIYATKNKLEINEDKKFDKYYIYKRPLLEYFLSEISKHFNIAIWSSADDNYVTEIVDLIKPADINFEFIWGRSKCSLRRDTNFDEFVFEKRLQKLKKKGFKLEQILIVDDTPKKSSYNYGNAIFIQEFLGNNNDEELKYLFDYLLNLKFVENVRTIEKRNWRTKSIS